MRIVDSEGMKLIDKKTIEEYGISDELLMENAGFEFVNAFLEDYNPRKSSRIAILCGGGNNGGDGFVVARHLRRRGYDPEVFLFVPEEKLKGIAEQNFKRLDYFNVKKFTVATPEELDKKKTYLMRFDLFIDALLGIGFKGSPRGLIREIIHFVNNLGRPVFSVDMPSGIPSNPYEGVEMGIRATATYTMGALKYGLVEYPGKLYAGRVRVLDIGFPQEVVESIPGAATLIDENLVRSFLKPRSPDSHKGNYGHLGVVCGRIGYHGASFLSARSAIRSGCGLVTIMMPREFPFNKPDDIISIFLPDTENPRFEEELEKTIEPYGTIIVGPGLGVSEKAKSLIEFFLGTDKRLIIDADGLNNIADKPVLLDKIGTGTVLTPHIGEMSRLTGLDKREIKNNKIEIAREYAYKWNVVLILKDSVTVVSSPNGEVFISDGGIPALAKGGSGDVLSGVIGALSARGMDLLESALGGVYIHGRAGRICSQAFGDDSVAPSDLIERIPDVFKELLYKKD